MEAVRLYKKNLIKVENIPFENSLKDDQVLVEIAYAGICGSDLHNYKTGCWISRSPSTPGHEFSGKILKIGKKVNSLKVNDHVIADSRVFCEDCYYCKKNLYHLCLNLGFVGELNDGGFAKFSIQKEKQLLKISKSIDLKNAALIEPLAVALHAISKFDNSKYNNVLIVGLGPIGVLSALSLREFGAKSIKIYDVNKHRLNKISHQLNFNIFDPAEDINEHEKPNFCIDATNSPNALQFILNNISKGGKISLVGLTHDLSKIEVVKIVEAGIELYGCAAFNNELDQAVNFLNKISKYISKIISKPISLHEVPYFYEKLLKNEVEDVKVIIKP